MTSVFAPDLFSDYYGHTRDCARARDGSAPEVRPLDLRRLEPLTLLAIATLLRLAGDGVAFGRW
jgi:hypothetical protein